MFFRRGKYMDFFICALFVVLLVYAYFSRRVLLDKLRREEEERLKLEHNANSLKEELKIVYYHTQKLEEALKAEQERHINTNTRLSSQSQDFKLNMTSMQKKYANKLKEKSESIQAYLKENEELKEKHQVIEKHFSELTAEHTSSAARIKREYDDLKKKKDEESLRLQDEIQETYNQKVYFQKKALLNEEDYKKTLKKLARCKAIINRRNATRTAGHKTSHGKKKGDASKLSKLADPNVVPERLPATTSQTLRKENLPTEKVFPDRYNLGVKQETNSVAQNSSDSHLSDVHVVSANTDPNRQNIVAESSPAALISDQISVNNNINNNNNDNNNNNNNKGSDTTQKQVNFPLVGQTISISNASLPDAKAIPAVKENT